VKQKKQHNFLLRIPIEMLEKIEKYELDFQKKYKVSVSRQKAILVLINHALEKEG